LNSPDKQFEVHSDNYNNHYIFSDYFSGAEIDPEAEVPEGRV
jgi:hypothetical protein